MSKVFTSDLASPRLILRRLQDSDSQELCGYRSLPEIARFQSWESFGPEDATRLIAGQREGEPGVPGTWFQLGIVERSSGRLVGDCGLHCKSEDPRLMEVGITLAPAGQRKGYAVEALESLLTYVFGVLGSHRVSAVTDAENLAAAALFRRLGFRQEAHLIDHLWFKGKWGSEFVFSMLKREWDLPRR